VNITGKRRERRAQALSFGGEKKKDHVRIGGKKKHLRSGGIKRNGEPLSHWDSKREKRKRRYMFIPLCLKQENKGQFPSSSPKKRKGDSVVLSYSPKKGKGREWQPCRLMDTPWRKREKKGELTSFSSGRKRGGPASSLHTQKGKKKKSGGGRVLDLSVRKGKGKEGVVI